jgi:uncharacterized protein (TIGR00369 family)
MKREIENPYQGGECFFCGRDNELGLQLAFWLDDELGEVSTEYVPERRFVGQGDILHGAMQMGLLDELMGWTTVVTTGRMAVTTDMSVRFLRPVYVCGEAVAARCRAVERRGRVLDLEAELTDADGVVCTTATSTYRLLSPESFARLVRHRGER